MFSAQFAELQAAREGAQNSLTVLGQVLNFVNDYRDPQGRSFEEAGVVVGQPYSLRETFVHGEQALRCFRALKLDKNKPVSMPTWRGAQVALAEVQSAANNLNGLVATVKADGRQLSIANGSTVVARDDSQVVADFAPSSNGLVAHSDALMQNLSVMMASVAASALAKNDQEQQTVTDFAKAAAAAVVGAESGARKADELAARLQALLDELIARRSAAETELSQAQATMTTQVDEAKRLLEQVTSATATVNDNATVVATRMGDVTKLKSQLDTANDALTAYQATLDTTKAGVQDAIGKSGQIIEDFEAKRTDVERIIQDAEKMLSGATAAGLATSFKEERGALDTRMLVASVWFGVGIVLLIATSMILAAYVLNLPFKVFGIDLSHPVGTAKAPLEPTIAGVLSRAIVLVGPFWLTLFSARRYRSLFELRQRYSHKYNMAVSMESFKKQAPSFAEQIGAWVFYVIAQDPVQRGGGTPMDEPPTMQIKDWGDILTDVVRKIFGGKPPA
jgi:hypothetical protein